MAGKGQKKAEEDELDSLLKNIGHAGVKAADKSRTKADVAMERGIPSVKARMDFLQAVVCGSGIVMQRFRDWLPDLSKNNLESLPKYARWRMESTVWKNPDVRPFSPPREDRVIFEEMLRHQLRVIWHRAVTGKNPKAPVVRLRSEVREFYHLLHRISLGVVPGPDLAGSCLKTESALIWLEQNTHKLRLCGIADCRQFPYFIATRTRKTYCSAECQQEAEDQRLMNRYKRFVEVKDVSTLRGKGTIPPRLTTEGKARISKAAKARWKKYRKDNGR